MADKKEEIEKEQAPQQSQQASKDASASTVSPTSVAPSPVAPPSPASSTSAPNIDSFPDIDEPEKKSLWLKIAIVLVFIILVGGGLYFLRTKMVEDVAKKEKKEKVTPTVTETASPTPATKSATVEIDISKYTIKVLNGSGISGEASRLKDTLSESEFNVDNIGNADKSDYEKTKILAKKKVPAKFLDKLKKELEKSYVLEENEELPEEEGVDVVITIGNSKP